MRAARWSLARALPLAVAGLSVVLGGCTSLRQWVDNTFKVGPNYRRPQAPIAPDWIEAGDPRVLHGKPADASWWTVLDDPVLDTLVEDAYRQNLTLKEAGFRVLAERAKLNIAVGNVFPQTQQAFGDAIRKGLSGTIANSRFTPERWFNVYDLGFNLSWEVDVWGRLRRAVEAADGDLNASVEDYDGVLVTLIADVANNYTQVRTLQAQIQYTRQNIELQTKTLALVKERFEGGAVSKLDVTQATENLAVTKAQLPPLEISLRLANDRLCTLLGIPMEDLTKKIPSGPIPSVPPAVAIGIPADLIRRRPDVRSAERQLAAQSARIGVAEAQLYPILAINGTIGYQSGELDDLFTDTSIIGTLGPSVRWNILNYGRLLNQIRVQDARFQELAMAYFNKVLKANEETENALAEFLRSQQLVKDLEQSVAAARESVDIVMVQYRDGSADFIRVFVAERELARQQDLLAKAQGQVTQGLIAIYRALGGGWQIRCRPKGIVALGPPVPGPEQLPPPRELPEPAQP